MTTATVATSAANPPTSLLCTPSSRSIISSARARASLLTSAEGGCKEKAPTGGAFSRSLTCSIELYGLFLEVPHRARMPRDAAGGRGLLVLELEVLRFLVHADQFIALLEHRLHDVVGGLLLHVLVRDEQVHHRGLAIVRVHALVGVLRDAVLDVELAVFLVHLVHEIGVVDELDLHAGRVGEVAHRGGRQPAHPEERVDLAVLERVGGLGDAEALAL